MKKILLIAALLCSAIVAQAQLSTSDYANSATGTTLNTLTKIVVNATVPQAQIMATTDTSGVVGITTKGTGTTGQATITYSGIVPCVFDNTTVANDFVQISATTAGNCHDVGATRPTSGQIVGVVAVTGGAAGTYNVLLDKSILPSSSGAPTPICSLNSSSDTLAAAGTFATTCPVPATAISGVGQMIHIKVHGVYSGGVGAPSVNLQINAGGTTGFCMSGGTGSSMSGLASASNMGWDAECFAQIVSTGAPGTAYDWGTQDLATAAGGGQTTHLLCNANPCTASTQSYTTTISETVSVQETATFVSGQSMTLTSLVVTNY